MRAVQIHTIEGDSPVDEQFITTSSIPPPTPSHILDRGARFPDWEGGE